MHLVLGRISSIVVATVGIAAGAGALGACSSGTLDNQDDLATSSGAIRGGNAAREACRTSRELQRGALVRSSDEDEDYFDREPSAVIRGRRAFDDRRLRGLHGNGRSCADCHMASEAFQLPAAAVEARYQALQTCRQVRPDADDPLFRPVDANDYRTNGDNATDYSNLRKGLVRITFQLPPNIKLIDPATNAPSSETFVDVWRAVPSVFNVALTGPDGMQPAWPPFVPPIFLQRAADGSQDGPNPSGGYQLDGRIDTLQNQAIGAFRDHAQVEFEPSQRVLDGLASFQDTLETGTAKHLTSLEKAGEAVFTRSCAQCHGGAGTSTPLDAPGATRYGDIFTACPRPVDNPVWCLASGGAFPCPPRFQLKACNAANGLDHLAAVERTYEITEPDGMKVRQTSSDPGRALLTGYVGDPPPATGFDAIPSPFDDFQKLDVPPLLGIAQTAPYFHNNSAATLEDVLDHYTQFFLAVQALTCSTPQGCTSLLITGPNPDGSPRTVPDRPFTPAERPSLLAYLRRL